MKNTVKGLYLKSRWATGPNITAEITDITYENIVIDEPEQYAIWIGPAQQADSADGCSFDYPSDPKAKCPVPAAHTWNNLVFRNITINKPGQSPGLYWHQDWMKWNDPVSLSPWCQTVFLNWYLTDTDRENGCLRVIPGSHRRRFDLHEHLIPPHEGGGYEIEETNQWMFLDHPQAIDVPVNAGQLVVADARLLHGTHPNKTDERRTLLLGWFFRRDTKAPDWWDGEVPQEILDRDPLFKADWTRQPGDYLR